jgi:hypothetical protein
VIRFGSDTSFVLTHVCVAIYSALPEGEATANQKAQVMGGNPLRLLGLTGSGRVKNDSAGLPSTGDQMRSAR